MRIQYVKQGGDGRVVDIEPGAGRRLIASGQAVEVGADDRPLAATSAAPAPAAKAARTAAKKRTAKKTTRRTAAQQVASAPAAGETGT